MPILTIYFEELRVSPFYRSVRYKLPNQNSRPSFRNDPLDIFLILPRNTNGCHIL
jgi:hypothetical protein